MSEHLQDIGDYYDKIADRYDTVTAATDWRVNDLVRNTLAELPTSQSDLIEMTLDIGAGTGQTIAAIRAALGRHGPPETVAVDASRKMLDLLVQKFPGDSITPVHEHIEAYLATNPHRHFDLITAMGSCDFMHALPNTLAILAGRLITRGHLMFTYIPQVEGVEPAREVHSPTAGDFVEYTWPREEIISRLEESGLVIVRHETLDAYQRGPQENRETVKYDFVAAQKPNQHGVA